MFNSYRIPLFWHKLVKFCEFSKDSQNICRRFHYSILIPRLRKYVECMWVCVIILLFINICEIERIYFHLFHNTLFENILDWGLLSVVDIFLIRFTLVKAVYIFTFSNLPNPPGELNFVPSVWASHFKFGLKDAGS